MKSKSRLSEVSLSVYYLSLSLKAAESIISVTTTKKFGNCHDMKIYFRCTSIQFATHRTLTMLRISQWIDVALEWVHAKSVISVCCSASPAKQNKLHKNGSIWVESNASKWKGKCGGFESPKNCMQIVRCGFTDSALSSALSLLPSLARNRSTANRLQRYKAISRSMHTSISRQSPYALSLVDMCVCYLRILFSTSKSPEISCFSIRMQSEQRRIHLACIVYSTHATTLTRIMEYTISRYDSR